MNKDTLYSLDSGLVGQEYTLEYGEVEIFHLYYQAASDSVGGCLQPTAAKPSANFRVFNTFI